MELTLMVDRKVLKHYSLDKDEVMIGRDKSCDIVIENVGISRKHTQLFRSGGVWILIDLSENGTYVRGQRIAQYNLNDGDEFWMGKFSVLFREPQQSESFKPAKAASHDNIEGTILVDQRAMERIAKERSSALAGYITFPRPDGKIETFTVMKTATWMGTEKSCDFRGAGFGVLKRHVLILRDTTAFVIYNLGKWKPAMINRKEFEEHVLKEGDVITWMGRDFTFHLGAPKL
ncbi:MAG: FHA domain-containing protein [Candidatus Brocadiae bacterium]|nr:FHA domain-containing protein [Candidatus Brocadiia bacterium]